MVSAGSVIWPLGWTSGIGGHAELDGYRKSQSWIRQLLKLKPYSPPSSPSMSCELFYERYSLSPEIAQSLAWPSGKQ